MYYLILSLAFCLSKLSAQQCFALGRGLGWFVAHVLRIRRSVVESNIDRVFGPDLSEADKKRLVLEAYQTLATVGLETLRLRFSSREEVLERTQLTGADHLDTALAAKRGVIVASGHFGNVVFSGCSEAARGVPVYVVAKDLKNKAAHKVYLEIMRRFGITRISTRRSKGAIVEALQKGAAVYMAVDQHMPWHRGLPCEFFGSKASTSPAPIRFALETDAPIVPCRGSILFESGGNALHYDEAFTIETNDIAQDQVLLHNTERLNRVLETYLRANPGQWLWQHKRWKIADLTPAEYEEWVKQSRHHFFGAD